MNAENEAALKAEEKFRINVERGAALNAEEDLRIKANVEHQALVARRESLYAAAVEEQKAQLQSHAEALEQFTTIQLRTMCRDGGHAYHGPRDALLQRLSAPARNASASLLQALKAGMSSANNVVNGGEV